MGTRPTPEQLAAAAGTTVPDVLAPGLDVLFCGINPGLYSAVLGLHFARPGNRFWPALHRGGFTPRQFDPSEQHELLALKLGVTNVAERATARADELSDDELRAGGQALIAKVERAEPRWLAVLGIGAYRLAFNDPKARVGRQERRIGPTRVWALPNPSGLNAHWTPAGLAEEFAALRTQLVTERPSNGLHPQ
ncbi:G/U mismatch-specific DNA glycosylase [Amycolatopsis sp. PS_44_ISF1]|uniref:G/U mismatch-specific DNA glycosylase n=1 Tax=Amycolatopsis sp. PS_44_ISF1 TaxID=2974917 RepID=UPI0028DFEACF|nr:G/U mismatch-specific DNA glycosylase [Amycolatopsis sp. PS_44_ISF1]MDT8910577.1 G/U mismatch-specific DNA glycosylase [Amycolatopsis sp. PS_44_ISF1]MDT8916344.1 G/U mismatch-specific DNA glycosylase [Amycolatopsis sp. PS_44_ISF1]MDT8916348.1 G/U mismatch-specific DNA glycosylase [Amycolatopsis sp. PS_44_ISF1]